ncbi:hypothetical protein FQA47_021848 [Oryzias melastigma]|uniref:Uncharacterized protein n=1 Tax=Oryzias melastigma TaxID=30732 RepID=A0A834C289_ORYME|nr:hypothetical protein FQA47_021848 [Oryzias melastigma]
MGGTQGSVLFFGLLVIISRSLASEGTSHETSQSTTNATSSSSGHETAVISTLPIVSWKWHHVSEPYLVALWILVCWLCKLGESQSLMGLDLQGSCRSQHLLID